MTTRPWNLDHALLLSKRFTDKQIAQHYGIKTEDCATRISTGLATRAQGRKAIRQTRRCLACPTIVSLPAGLRLCEPCRQAASSLGGQWA